MIKEFTKVIKTKLFNFKYNTNIMSTRASLNAKYGSNVSIGYNTYVEEDVSIGSFTYINSNSYVENCSIGKFCSISSGVYISPFEHNNQYITTHPILYNKVYGFVKENTRFTRPKVNIGNDVLISLNCIILEGINIGHGAIIGAGSIVTKDVKPYEIVGGVPAKHIKYRFEMDKINYLLNLQWWDWDREDILKNIDFLKS